MKEKTLCLDCGGSGLEEWQGELDACEKCWGHGEVAFCRDCEEVIPPDETLCDYCAKEAEEHAQRIHEENVKYG